MDDARIKIGKSENCEEYSKGGPETEIAVEIQASVDVTSQQDRNPCKAYRGHITTYENERAEKRVAANLWQTNERKRSICRNYGYGRHGLPPTLHRARRRLVEEPEGSTRSGIKSGSSSGWCQAAGYRVSNRVCSRALPCRPTGCSVPVRLAQGTLCGTGSLLPRAMAAISTASGGWPQVSFLRPGFLPTHHTSAHQACRM